MLKVEAPAKINLTLEILGKRSDGYHELRSVIQTINLCDTLCFSENDKVEFNCDLTGWTAEKSLISRAVSLFKQSTGCVRGVSIVIEKRIPMMAGLGGDSSDAAGVLLGLNKLWGLNLSHENLLSLAPQLGSDVTFFLHGGTCLMEGRGERLTPLPQVPRQWVILAVPSFLQQPGKTRRMFESLLPVHFTDGRMTERLVVDLRERCALDASRLFNTFENIAFAHGADLTTYWTHILKIGAPHVHLAGSGPAMFTLFQDRHEAEELLSRLNNQGMNVYLAEMRGKL